MGKHDIVVIGASAGGVEALQELVPLLPASLPAAVFVVIHMYPRSRSFLPEILGRVGRLPAVAVEDGMAIEHGRIYCAVPDHHLVIERGHVHLSSGPKEQHQRPCSNVTFRAAALAYGDRVTGVVLTGQMDDGTAGLWEIKRRGGIAVVQNPEEALFPAMPLGALREIEADYTVRLKEMAPLLARLATEDAAEPVTKSTETSMEPKLTDLTCPDCRGTIWEVPRGNGTEYRCRVGHVFSPRSMLAEHFAAQEKALYGAIVALEEGASLATRLAGQFEKDVCERLLREARERAEQAEVVRKLLRERQSFSLD